MVVQRANVFDFDLSGAAAAYPLESYFDDLFHPYWVDEIRVRMIPLSDADRVIQGLVGPSSWLLRRQLHEQYPTLSVQEFLRLQLRR